MCSSKQQLACMECTRKCFRIHGKKPSSSLSPHSTSPSFFKIMIGDFEDAMFLPPKFAQILGGLVNKNIYLEDSVGNCWMAKISVIDGSLAFQQGWRNFVLDHSISVGEIVIFKQISISLFSVQIYGISGCERVLVNEKKNSNNRKRKRSKNEISPDILCLSKAHKSSEDSEENHYPADKDSLKKDMVRKTFSCDLVGNEMATRNHVTKGTREDLNSLEQYPHRENGPRRRKNLSTMNYCKAPCKMIVGDAMRAAEEEAGRISPIDLCDDEDMDTMIMTKDDSFLQDDKSGRLLNTSPVEYGKSRKGNLAACNRSISRRSLSKERKSSIKDSVCKQELTKTTTINSVDPENFQSKCYSQDTDRLVVKEGNLSHHRDRLRRPKTFSTAVHTTSETKNQSEASWAITTYPLTEERMPRVGCLQGQNTADKDWMRDYKIHTINESEPEKVFSKLDDEEFVGNSYERPQSATPNFVEEGGNLIASKGVVRITLVTEDGICHIVDEDFMDEIGASKHAPFDLCATERDCSGFDADKVGITWRNSSRHESNLEVLSNAPILNCSRVVKENSTPSCNGISNYNQSEGNLGNPPDSVNGEEEASRVRSVRSSPSIMIDMSGMHKDPVVMQGTSCQPGIVPDVFPEVGDERITPCLKGEVLGVVKTECMDSTDLPSPNYANFSITMSVISQSWLLLPERLPARLLKKRHERRVVVLRDPSMRLWPVLYHESLKFIGFVAGWEDFAMANNLRQGDTCEIESAGGSEPMFQVRISKA